MAVALVVEIFGSFNHKTWGGGGEGSASLARFNGMDLIIGPPREARQGEGFSRLDRNIHAGPLQNAD